MIVMRAGTSATRLANVRVITQNLLGHHQDRPRRPPAAASMFRRLDPDVVTLQETIATDGEDQAIEVLGDGYHVTHHRVREPDGSGITIASRWPIGTVREPDLQVGRCTSDFAASAQVADSHGRTTTCRCCS